MPKTKSEQLEAICAALVAQAAKIRRQLDEWKARQKKAK